MLGSYFPSCWFNTFPQLLLSLSSLFFGHALTRPFANSIETTLTAAVLCWWPFPDEKLSDTKIKTSPSVTQPEEGRFSDR